MVIFSCKKESTSPSEQPVDFGIYLLKDSMMTTTQAKQIALDSLVINDQSITNINDIVYYQWSDHSVELTKDGFNKFKFTESKIKSTYGLPFIVVANGSKVYLGNIYPYYSSYIHTDLPSIGVSPFISLKIERAPDKSIEDKRNDPRIYIALETNKKLK
jgi:hypothetical protein